MLFWTDHDALPIMVPYAEVAGAFLKSSYAVPPFDRWPPEHSHAVPLFGHWPLDRALAGFLATHYGGAAWDLADFEQLAWIVAEAWRQAVYIFGPPPWSWTAERALRHATELATHDRRAQFQLGQLLAQQGKLAAALEAWRAADAAQYFVQQGQALARDGKFEDAVRYYKRALTIQPDLYEGYESLGRALLRLGLKEEALNAFSSAVALEPETSAHRYLLQAEIHIAREEWAAALAAYQQTAVLASKDPVPHYKMGLILQRDPTSEVRALAHFQYALHLDPDHIAARQALGRLYAKRGNCEEAINALSSLFFSGFSERVRTQALAIAGRCLMDQGHPREALVYLDQVVALNPQSVPHRCMLADAYAQAGRYHDAIETYLQVLEIDPDNARARQALEALDWVEP